MNFPKYLKAMDSVQFHHDRFRCHGIVQRTSLKFVWILVQSVTLIKVDASDEERDEAIQLCNNLIRVKRGDKRVVLEGHIGDDCEHCRDF